MGTDADAGVWRAARRRLFLPVDAVLLVVTVVCLAGVRISPLLQYAPFALGLVILGLPHGALDHLVPARLAGRRPDARSIGLVVLLYFVLGAAVAALWAVAPAVAFAVFIATTLLHWGQGDLFVLLARGGPAISRGIRWGILLLRGALPMLVPLVAFPSVYLGVRGDTTAVGGRQGAPAASILLSPGFRIGLAGALVLLGVIALGALAHLSRGTAEGRRLVRGEVCEVVLLAAFFAVVPPVLAIGLYFALWHSLRHVVRLALLDPALRPAAEAGRFGRVVVGFSREAAPLTLGALALLIGLFVVLPRSGTSAGSLLGLYLVLISALTLPHVVVVAVMDRRQGVWRRVPGVVPSAAPGAGPCTESAQSGSLTS
ncbi:Beta-carotene 15,15'-dioxygenase [Frondihabitans sp. 762G35]|uniref:Brp/Blh family beta-carotene 15,15'-dioxygenase n=1 Tax=Frondihabitans sp. 762G35 TaxID=1446794 RepID=UPI000D22A78A|nr:Brp/Blh family beta-carotene 15,15'-dioxygenase [Frondihabitans sp. 762G35]ARC55622.1 Beta-carotene 15,15'-dioxygenase [Frondihabitans sp. 762G35]